MAIINTPYTHSLKILCGGGDWLADDVRLALLSSGYTFSAAHTLFDNGANNATDPSFSELTTGDGYTAGGAALTTSIADNKVTASPVTFTALDKTFRQGVIYINATVDTLAKPVLFHILFDNTPADITIPGVDFAVNWNANGIAILGVA
jgi:hypothetical protein